MIAVNGIVEASHIFVARHVRQGDICIDATAGNGHDSLFLAGLVGDSGLVHIFDIQEKALANTRVNLAEQGFSARARLYLNNHRDIPELVSGPVRAVMFNLGYLPGGDKGIITSGKDSVAALAGCLDLLDGGGIITAVTYSGHPGGEEEEEAVASWFSALDARGYSSSCLQLINKNKPPKLWMAVKK